MSPLIEILESCNTDLTGADRHSELVNLIYGKYGFYFKESDEYKIRAYYIGLKNMMVPSNTLTFRVGHDPSIEKKYSNGYFSYKVGMNLYFHGSMSKSLVDGRKFLSKLAKENKDSIFGSKLAYILGKSEMRPFYSIENNSLKRVHSPDYKEALKITEPAYVVYKKRKK